MLHLRADILKQAGISESDALIEFACRLFEGGKLDLWPAAQLAGLTRSGFEYELRRRRIPAYRPTLEQVRSELEQLEKPG